VTAEARPRVLVIDDEESNLETFQRVFRRDLRIELCSSGREALSVLRQREFDAILVDYSMPGMNGAQFLQAAAELQPEAVRMMVTAHADLDEVRGLKASGMVNRTIIKPWDRDHLLQWIQNAARITAMRRALPPDGGSGPGASPSSAGGPSSQSGQSGRKPSG
jgi:CheY-like chemotaxis protein